MPERDVHGGIELTERLGRDVEPRQDAGRLDDDRAVAADVAGHRGLGRDVAPPEILRERAADDLAIDRRIERFEGYGSHSGRSRRALRRCQFDVDLQHFGHERVDLLNLARGAQILLDVGQELELVLAARGRRCARPASSAAAAPRTSSCGCRPSTCAAICSACAPRSSAPPATARISASVGHGALWTEPGCHHDQTSSVANGRNGANSRRKTESAVSSAVFAEPASASPWSP